MSEKPKPLTKAEWEDGQCDGDWDIRLNALVDALFRYRERTRGMFDPGRHNAVSDDDRDADTIAADEGIE